MHEAQRQSWMRSVVEWPKAKYKWVNGVKVYDEKFTWIRCNDLRVRIDPDRADRRLVSPDGARIDHNAADGFGGAFLIVPPEGWRRRDRHVDP